MKCGKIEYLFTYTRGKLCQRIRMILPTAPGFNFPRLNFADRNINSTTLHLTKCSPKPETMDHDLDFQGQTSSIFKLPPELRCKIYEEVLISNRPLELDPYLQDSLLPPALSPALLQTCRIIRHEAQPIYYGQNTFVARPWGVSLDSQLEQEAIVKFLTTWLTPLKASNCLHFVRRINIINIFWVNPEALRDLKAVNFALAEHGAALATDVLRVLIMWDEDFWNRAITNPNWLQVESQWESWLSILRRVKAEDGESLEYLDEAAAHAAWVESLDLLTPTSSPAHETVH